MKYILYKTTNLINNYIYIGVHKTSHPEIFDKYLGNGVYVNKPSTYQYAKTCFQQAVKQFGVKNFYREVLSIYDTPEEAYAAEALIVNDNFLARHDVYNMIKGGIINNVIGRKVYKYNNNSGKLTLEFSSIEEAAKECHTNPSTLFYSIKFKFQIRGFVYSFSKQDKIDLSEYNFKEKIEVYRYLKTGEFDKTFKSLTEAGEETLDSSAAYIQKAAILGYLVKDSYYFSFYQCDSYDKARTLTIKNRKVYKYDSNGKFVEGFQSQNAAERLNPGINITKSIRLRCKDQNDCYWSLEELPFFNIPCRRIAKKVAKLDEFGNILQTWDSSNLCAKEVGTGVKNVLRGEYEKHKGFKYKYIE